jgi:hypothetical protein
MACGASAAKPESEVLHAMRSARILLSVLALSLIVSFAATNAAAQTWWVQSADYGAGNQRRDVTNTVKRLVNGPNFRVNNNNMGVDPAVGRDKVLRIVAKDSRGTVRDFSYKEGSTVNAQMFTGGPGSGPGWPGWNGGGRPGNGGGYDSNLRITSAKWGFGGAQRDVTGRLQGMVRNNRLSVKANNQSMGGDPSPGNNKMLTVFYDYRGRNQSKVAPEGSTLHLP